MPSQPMLAVLARLPSARPYSGGWIARCPAHEDTRPSLSMAEGDDGRVLMTCHAGCSIEKILDALKMSFADLFVPKTSNNGHDPTFTVLSCYEYTDEAGKVLYEVLRYYPKDFRQRRPDPDKPGQYIWNTQDVRRVLYRLRDLVRSKPGDTLVVVEGEKDVATGLSLGLNATTNAGGAGKWRGDFNPVFAGRRVVIVPDNDEPGRNHARVIAIGTAPVAESVKIVALPDDVKDLTEWVEAGGTREQFDALVAATPGWTPQPESPSASSVIPPIVVAPLPPPAPPSDPRPMIVVRNEMGPVVAEAQSALAHRATNLYCRAGMLVHIQRDGARDIPGLVRPPHAPVIQPLTPTRVRAICDEVAFWARKHQSHGQDVYVSALPPTWVAESLCAQGTWPFPILEGVSETPIFRRDGGINSEAGYDPQTAIFYDPGGAVFPAVPESPTLDDACNAKQEIFEPLCNFPWVEPCDGSAAFAAILTVVARNAISGACPMFVFRSPTPASGKGRLCDTIAIIGTGRVAARMVSPDNEEEVRKRTLSIAMEGTRIVLLDNLSGSVGSPALANALTAEVVSDRILGKQGLVTVPLRTVWLANGNNISFRGDFMRRVVVCDINPNVEHPEDRTDFRYPDLLGEIRERRPALVSHVLTILRAYHLAGRPSHGQPLNASFEEWDKLIRGCIIWMGMPDPLESRERVRGEGDLEVNDLQELLEAWYTVFGSLQVTVADLIASGDEPLKVALAACDQKGSPNYISPRHVSLQLGRWKDRIVNKKSITFTGVICGRKRWRLVDHTPIRVRQDTDG